ncbi:MAG: ribosome silencing factor [bacterium]|nr:ribosome silencing factor [bacterium]
MKRTAARRSPSGKALAMRCGRAAAGKKALDVLLMDMRGLSSITDYFVVCSGTSDRHVKAIADGVVEEVGARGRRCLHRDGPPEAGWTVIDFGEAIVHVFGEEARRYYGIERLWGDAAVSRLREPRPGRRRAAEGEGEWERR